VTSDQAALTAEFLGLGELESEYFVLLVNYDRAGNETARKLIKKQLRRVKEEAQNLGSRIQSEARLSEEQRAVFYSDWAYTAIRQATAIPGLNDAESISEFLGLSPVKVRRLIEFLVRSGLCKEANRKLVIGPASTYVEASSPWVRVHHTNWREKAISSLDAEGAGDLHYTSPLTISLSDSELVRERIIKFIEQINEIVDPSPSESLHCLNIDWFKVSKR
jgi:uncharacterized protein (TIGR02147 family)